MNRKLLVLLMVLSLVFLTSCGKKKQKDNTPETAATTAATTEETIYGLEDNPFNVEGWETAETQPPAETAEAETKPAEKQPQQDQTSKVPDGPAAQPDNNAPEHPVEQPDNNVPEQPAEQPDNTSPQPTEKPEPAPLTEYEKYQAMSAEEQMALMNSFESVDAFFEWYNSAREEYEALNPPIEIGNGPIDMSEFFKE